MPDPSKLTLTLGSLTSPSEPPGSQLTTRSSPRSYHARFVRAGHVRKADNSQSNIEVLPEALSRAVERGLFNSKAVFIDHAGFWENPSLRDLVGDTHSSVFTTDAVEGVIDIYNTPDGQVICGLLDEILAQGQDAPDVGLSIVFYPVWDSSPYPQDGGD